MPRQPPGIRSSSWKKIPSFLKYAISRCWVLICAAKRSQKVSWKNGPRDLCRSHSWVWFRRYVDLTVFRITLESTISTSRRATQSTGSPGRKFFGPKLGREIVKFHSYLSATGSTVAVSSPTFSLPTGPPNSNLLPNAVSTPNFTQTTIAGSKSMPMLTPKEKLLFSTHELSERILDRVIMKCSDTYSRYVMPSGIYFSLLCLTVVGDRKERESLTLHSSFLTPDKFPKKLSQTSDSVELITFEERFYCVMSTPLNSIGTEEAFEVTSKATRACTEVR